MDIPSMNDLGLKELDARDKALYMMWESSHARAERTNKRLWVIVLVLIVALVGTNAGWLWWESQWQYVKTETTIDATQDGDNNYLSGGDLYYGTENEDNQNDTN